MCNSCVKQRNRRLNVYVGVSPKVRYPMLQTDIRKMGYEGIFRGLY